MRFLPCVLLLAVVLASCSDSDSPTSPPPARESRYELRPSYYWSRLENGDPDLHETLRDRLVVRFRDDVTEQERDDILEQYGLAIVLSEHPHTRQILVATSDAFATAPKLWREDFIECVGPVFDLVPSLDCGTAYPTNSFAILGDRSDPTVVAALQKAGATLVNEFPWNEGVYVLPWDDPNELFDLVNELDEIPAVEDADPTLILSVCPTQ